MSDATFDYQGELNEHRGWVTSIATAYNNNDYFYTASRDGTVLSWKRDTSAAPDQYAIPQKRFEGHSGFVQDIALSQNGEYALTASWDKTIRLWSTGNGACRSVFRGHTKDVLSVAFSTDGKKIISGGRDNAIKIWNIGGKCEFTLNKGGHTDWVSCVRYSPRADTEFFVSVGYDNQVRVWNENDMTNPFVFNGHTAYLNTVAVSPDASLCASGGKDGLAKLWDLGNQETLYELDAGETIHSLAFSPNRYWLSAATESCLRIWDLQTKKELTNLECPQREYGRKALKAECISLAWSMDGNTVYAGFSDKSVHIFNVRD